MHTDVDVRIPAGTVELDAIWSVPEHARGTVAFAHGSGSSRKSARNQFVARTLQRAGFATLLLDLLTLHEEEYDRRTSLLRFDIAFLSTRLEAALNWCLNNKEVGPQWVGLFGASTGAAASLVLAARCRSSVNAIVSRGGRVDMAGPSLREVRAPTLLIVGSEDRLVVDLNTEAAKELVCEHDTAVVAGASHLFEEPGTLERVAELARGWFLAHSAPGRPAH